MTPSAQAPAVLLPGMANDARAFDDAIAGVLGPVQSVHALRGRSVAEMADRVLAAAPPVFAVCGFSLGGIVALELATRAPDRVTSVTAIGCSARAPTLEQEAAWRTLDGHAARGDLDAMVDAMLPALLGPGERARLSALIHDMARTVGVAGVRDQLAAQRSRPDRRAVLAGVRTPTLLVAAGEDSSCPVERVAEVAEAIPGARLEVVSGAPHLCTLTHPHAVARILVQWGQLGASLPPPTSETPKTNRPGP